MLTMLVNLSAQHCQIAPIVHFAKLRPYIGVANSAQNQ